MDTHARKRGHSTPFFQLTRGQCGSDELEVTADVLLRFDLLVVVVGADSLLGTFSEAATVKEGKVRIA